MASAEKASKNSAWTLTDIALVIRSRTLDTSFLSQHLPLAPTLLVEPGSDPRDADGEWRLECDERTTRDFSEQLDFILSRIESCTQQLAQIKSRGCDVYIRVYGFSHNEASLTFEPSEWDRIHRTGLHLDLVPNVNAR